MMVLDKHAPVKTKRVKRNNQPESISDEIKTAIKKRDVFHKTKNWKEYKYWRNQVTSLIRSAKKAFSLNPYQKIRTIRFYGAI